MKTFFKILKYVVDIDIIEDVINNTLDINEMLLEKSKKIFNNKCYDNSFILNVNKLINRSYIDITNLSCNIEIEVECLNISKYDIICNNIIENMNQDKIVSKHKYFSSVIKNKPEYNLKIGDTISIIVGEINYMLNKKKFTISGSLMIPFNKNDDIYYIIDKSLSNDELKSLNKFIEKIKNEYKKVSKLKRFKYFNELLYKYKSTNTSQLHNLFDIINNNETDYMISLLNNINKLDFKVYANKDLSNIKVKSSKLKTKSSKKKQSNLLSENVLLGSENNPIIENAYNVYNSYLCDIYKYIDHINDMCETYESDDLFNENQHVFKLYNSKKL